MRRFRSALMPLCLLVASCGWAQEAAAPQPTRKPPFDDPQFHQRRNDDDVLEKMKYDAAKQQNLDRQKALKKDTDELLKLATQLKKYVDQTNENILSVDVMKKAEEIEKLAHEVREKMKAQ